MPHTVSQVSEEPPKATAHPNLFQGQANRRWSSCAVGGILVRQERLFKKMISHFC